MTENEDKLLNNTSKR